jgi:hypothetical protein
MAHVADNMPVRGNVECTAAVMKLTVTNRSASGANAIQFSSMTIAFTAADGVTPLSGATEASLFSSISVFADNLTNGTTGTYQRDIDKELWGTLPSSSFIASSRQTILATDPNAAICAIAPNSSKTYFVAVTFTATANTAGNFRSRKFQPAHRY